MPATVTLLDSTPAGVCELANWIAVGNSRHYCFNAATCTLRIDEDTYECCDACRDEIMEWKERQ